MFKSNGTTRDHADSALCKGTEVCIEAFGVTNSWFAIEAFPEYKQKSRN
jgi:hypothetical protein